jgi:hypothetical protein
MVDENVVAASAADHAINCLAKLIVTCVDSGMFAPRLLSANRHSNAPRAPRIGLVAAARSRRAAAA